MNDEMMQSNVLPKVTKCVIKIKEALVWHPTDAFLMRTAVSKYFIPIGQELGKFESIDMAWGPMPAIYPLIQIDPENGKMALKCPTISGGKWMRNVNDFDKCYNKESMVKGQKLNLLFM